MYRFMFTASGLNPFYCESMAEAREYMQEYAAKGHKDCKVWSLTDFMNCQDQFAEIPKDPDRVPEFVRAMEADMVGDVRAAVDSQLAQVQEHSPFLTRMPTMQEFLNQKYSTTPVPDPSTLPQNEGRKYDSGELRYSLLPLRALEEVVRVLEFGAKKYGDYNWRMVENAYTRYWNAAMRHMFATQNGESQDPETKLLHEAHAICYLLFRAELQLQSEDNEPKQDAYGDYQ